ncbi:MAG: DNA repair protein RecN [Nevskiales bacterium]
MLQDLHIRQFAIVDELDIEFEPGMTVLTGETGAGKSILIDALGLLLGDRADSNSVREGAKRAEISAVFNLNDASQAQSWLSDNDFVDEDDPLTCLIRRTVGADGRGKALINGSPATVKDLKVLGEKLLDIHGQHAHQSLLKGSEQRDLLDDYGGHLALRKSIAETCLQYRQSEQRLQSLSGAEDHSQRMDFLRYQITELEALDLKEGELESIETEHKRLANAGRLLEDGQRALGLLYGEDGGSCYDLIGQAGHLLQNLSDVESSFGSLAEAIDSARIQIQEAANTLRHNLDDMDLDPARLDWLDKRLTAIHDLARKHHIDPESLPEHLESLRTELHALDNAGEEIAELEKQLADLRKQYQQLSAELHKARCGTAKQLSEGIEAIVRELGMPQASFTIAVTPRKDEELRSTGADDVDFLICANPGQAARPLSKVASGGELSRISLAIQVIAANSTQVPSLIFDEVDSGIGGGVAEIVGRQLRTLGNDRQTLCVTHLPQVAAQAHRQLFVRKQVIDGNTRTSITELLDNERIEELARMLGGVEITDQSRAHAEEMLQRAAE